jgi:hypothetical protein
MSLDYVILLAGGNTCTTVGLAMTRRASDKTLRSIWISYTGIIGAMKPRSIGATRLHDGIVASQQSHGIL